MKKDIIKEVEDFELKHKIIFLIMVILATIIITRILVIIKDPNIFLYGYEMHHFYYGVLLLIITNLLILFQKKKIKIYLILSGISIGLIADEFLYVAGGFGNTQIYYSTLPSAIVFSIFILIIAVLINYFTKK